MIIKFKDSGKIGVPYGDRCTAWGRNGLVNLSGLQVEDVSRYGFHQIRPINGRGDVGRGFRIEIPDDSGPLTELADAFAAMAKDAKDRGR